MRRGIVPRDLRFWAVCLGSDYRLGVFTANIQMSHNEEFAMSECLTLFASVVQVLYSFRGITNQLNSTLMALTFTSEQRFLHRVGKYNSGDV